MPISPSSRRMRIERVVVRHIRVPLKVKFRTAQTERTESDNVVVEVVLEDGTSGFGEGVPREYVTGETVTTCFEFLRRVVPDLLGKSCAGFPEAVELAGELTFGDDPLRPQCAARAALEIALLDAAGRCFGISLSRLVEFFPDLEPIAQRRDEVCYGVVLSAGTGAIKALAYRLYGFRDVKLKVGIDAEEDIAFVERMRRWLGPRVDIRVDANGAWSPKEASRIMRGLRKFDVSFVEQPVSSRDQMHLAEIRLKVKLGVMVDESLISERDAHLAIDGKLCDAFNLKISKNGGLIPTLHLAKLAMDSALGVQLGCHPGETGILSAAGRAIASSVRDLLYVEGSYDRHLLKRNVIEENITFGRGGRAPRLTGAGLGVTVRREDLDALTVEVLTIE